MIIKVNLELEVNIVKEHKYYKDQSIQAATITAVEGLIIDINKLSHDAKTVFVVANDWETVLKGSVK
jgi:hypothetical protein